MRRRDDQRGNRNKQARPRRRNRLRYALGEFLFVPLLVVGIWIALAVVAIMLDRIGGAPGRAVAVLVPPEATSTLLETMTPGLVTVVSIIYFVLLMAVQHQSATYTPVVLDQFLRRRTNQLFFGMFVGLTVYCLLILALLRSGQAVISGAIALVLAIITFVSLLVFVYSTVDQMRPSAAVGMLRRLALRARARQQPLLARCRTQPHLAEEPATQVTSHHVGHIVHIDVELLARALRPVSDTLEIELRVAMGEHVVPTRVLADVRGGTSTQRERLAGSVLDAITLGRMRDIDRDPGRTVDHLSNMAWSATAASGDPDGARIAVETLHTLLVEFQNQDRLRSPQDHGGALPLVYHDQVPAKILDGLTSVITASVQSGQHHTCSDALTVLSQALPRLEYSARQTAVDRLQRVLPAAQKHVFSADMEAAFDAIRDALHENELGDAALRVAQIKDQLHEGQRLATPTDAGEVDGQAQHA